MTKTMTGWIAIILTALACACGGAGADQAAGGETNLTGDDGPDGPKGHTPGPTPPPAPAPPPPNVDAIRDVYGAVDQKNIEKLLGEIAVGERWSPAGKKRFRDYFTQYFTGLGATVKELPFKVANLVGETQGHNIEAVLPGKSKDSVVILAHYDTVGIDGKETQNPGADDAGSGLAMMFEAARIFAAKKDRAYTVRFAAADYEEITDLEGDIAYVDYLQKDAAANGYKIVVAANNDQTAWSCWSEGKCGANAPAKNSTFQFIACSGDKKNYAYPELTKAMNDTIQTTGSKMAIDSSCDGSGDTDHYAFWMAGLPAYVVEEYGSENNPHYDDTGDDTLKHIDFDYLFEVSRVNIALQARLVGIGD